MKNKELCDFRVFHGKPHALGAAAVVQLFFGKWRRARRPSALPSRSWRASEAPWTWAGTATSAYADAPTGKCGGPPGPSRSVWRPAAHPSRRRPSRLRLCEEEGSVEQVGHRCVPRETARPCGRRASAGDGAVLVGPPHFPHGAGGPPGRRAWAGTAASAYADAPKGKCCGPPGPSGQAVPSSGRDPSLAGPSENDLWGSAEACWVAMGSGGPEREGSRPGHGEGGTIRTSGCST